jgi:A/G-specific adenine glycosylase
VAENAPAVVPDKETRSPSTGEGFARPLLDWFDAHGRHDLPWQRDSSPYRVWVSEVMLQQTQVATVIPYYERFMARFPNVTSLAAAPIDEVLHLWTGLGYYARARNLHRAARVVVAEHGGSVPDDLGMLQALPGIGRSTAGAILALAHGRRHPILDGNARRVIARYFGVEGHIGETETLRRMWGLADASTPYEGVAAYTQAVMDLGATMCTRSQPKCENCPLRRGCVARATGRQSQIPAPRPQRTRPHRTTIALIVRREGGAVLLEQRPEAGLWGGLWAFPQFDSQNGALDWLRVTCGELGLVHRLAPYSHAFTHFDLTLQPVLVEVGSAMPAPEGHLWYDAEDPPRVGVTKPVTGLLAHLADGTQVTLV